MQRKFTEEQQKEIAKRDGCCQLCYSHYNLDKPHHIWYGSKLPKNWVKGDDPNGLWNGVLLCITCHAGFHHTGKFGNGDSLKNNRMLLEYISQERYDKFKNGN